MRCFPIVLIIMAVHLVEAAINDGNNPNEIPHIDNSILPDNDLDEVLIFEEGSDYEEIKLRSLSKYIHISEELNSDDESNSENNKDAIKRNKKGFHPEYSPGKTKFRKRRRASCTPPPQSFNCDPSAKYRRIDGSCNNLQHPEWGMAMGCQIRFLPANYANGMASFRKSVKGGPLPEPRNLSVDINPDEDHPDEERTHMSMFFSQAFAHDIVLTPTFAEPTGELLRCCALPPNDNRCANINLPKNDTFYGPLNETCIDFPRAINCTSCDPDGREILNMQTSFLDASLVYGSSEATSQSLRMNDGSGKLRSQMTPVGELLPNSSNPKHDECSVPDKDRICFEAGDPRVNQHLIITCLQTIFLREHNRVATIFKKLNPSWEEDTIFEETRKIIGAALQHIFYSEYVPIVLDKDTIAQWGLGTSDGFTTYDNTSNPSMWVEFTTAAFRVPHSTINTVVSKIPRLVTEGKVWLRDLYSRPFGLRSETFGPLMKDTTETEAQQSDRYSVPDVNDYIYRVPGDPAGLDLSAIDYQRGRDHGLPTYVDLVKLFLDITIESFDDLEKEKLMSDENKKLLQRYYKSVKDIDLELAMMMEERKANSLLGPLAAQIFGFQCNRLKFGDRYFYTHGKQSGSFTKAQLKEIKKYSITLLICNNVDGVLGLPKSAMLLESPKTNPLVLCEVLKGRKFQPNYSKWK